MPGEVDSDQGVAGVWVEAAGDAVLTANGVIATLTFASAYASAPYCVISPQTSTAADIATGTRTIHITTTAPWC